MKRAALMLLLPVIPASAQSTDTVRLAPGEVPLRIVADGKARAPADAVVLIIPVSGSGTTAAAATAAVQATVARVRATLGGVGVPAAAITSGQPASPVGFIGNDANDEDGPVALAAATAAREVATQSRRQNSLAIRVLLGNVSMLARVEQALDAINQAYGTPLGILNDEGPARQAAVAEAARHARAEAEAYAAALGMRVVRVLAVSDMPTSNDLTAGWTIFAAINGLAPAATEVETRRHIQIDYALMPR